MRIGTILSASLLFIQSAVTDAKPLSVSVVLSGKKYSVKNVNTVSELQSSLESQSGVSSSKQKVLFGGKKLKPVDVLEDVGVEDGSVINVVSSKKNAGDKKKKGTVAAGSDAGAAAGGAGAGGAPDMDQMMKDMMAQAGVDPAAMDEMMQQMGGSMPSMEESMEAMQEMMNSPMFQEYMENPEKLEESRQMILNNPMMKGMMASMPGFDEILNDPIKWRETMIAAASMYKNLGSDLSKLMEGGDMGGFGGMPGMGGFGGLPGMDTAGLDDLSEGE
jgi:actin-related protein